MQYKHYLVFLRDDVRNNEEDADKSCPVLLADFRAKNLTEAVSRIRSDFTDIPMSRLDFFEVTGMKKLFVLDRENTKEM